MALRKGKILWVDDEVELLKSHILFLRSRGFEVVPVSNGNDAVELVSKENFNLVLLDEMMSGKDGLTTLREIKDINPSLPVIMITKNEEESLMEKAIGGKITDYLTKPVNPSQILMACKKVLEQQRISSEHASRDYMLEFHQISKRLYDDLNADDWIDIYQKLCRWQVEFDLHPDLGLQETLVDQMRDCNIEFGKFIEKNYTDWIHEDVHFRPTLSPDIIRKNILPLLKKDQKVLLLIIDCLRVDQWMVLEPLLYDFYNIKSDYYFSVIPSATPYARNAIFRGLFPDDIQNEYPDIWTRPEEDDEISMNRHEFSMLQRFLEEEEVHLQSSLKYEKVIDSNEGWAIDKKINSYLNHPFLAVVANFVDILAHRRSDSDILKEIVSDETSYRSVIKSWFQHSWIFSMLRKFAENDYTVILTSDHGSVRVQNDVKVIADKTTSPNVRFKVGNNLNCPPKYALVIKDPGRYKLPTIGINSNYLISKENFYFVYPNNYHKFQAYYRDTFQHGGMSMEEMILPVVTMTPKNM